MIASAARMRLGLRAAGAARPSDTGEFAFGELRAPRFEQRFDPIPVFEHGTWLDQRGAAAEAALRHREGLRRDHPVRQPASGAGDVAVEGIQDDSGHGRGRQCEARHVQLRLDRCRLGHASGGDRGGAGRAADGPFVILHFWVRGPRMAAAPAPAPSSGPPAARRSAAIPVDAPRVLVALGGFAWQSAHACRSSCQWRRGLGPA